MNRRTMIKWLAAGAGVSLTPRLLAEGQQQHYPVEKTADEWRAILTPLQYHILREEGTERAFTSPLDKEYGKGVYECIGCGQVLFTSETKYDSGTGWPSFWQPVDGALGTKTDYKLIYPRTEYHCSRCGGHHGHVFNDGPKPTGKRYCNNGAVLKFVPADA